MNGFFKGAAVAAVLALAGAISFAGLSSLIGAPLALHLVIIALGGVYILYLLSRASDRTGRIAVFAAWLTATIAMAIASDGLAATLVTQTVLISVVRSLYHHASVLAGLLDLGLSAMAMGAAVWASSESGSFFLTAWSYFLVHALYSVIPSRFTPAPTSRTTTDQREQATEDRFDRAVSTAEAAFRRIATHRQ